uniref:Uncharacterized protein n=1 Tax=Cacopsylla melanoneura TaxID=428564 RepID=A0A8D8L9Z8_9HEMI
MQILENSRTFWKPHKLRPTVPYFVPGYTNLIRVLSLFVSSSTNDKLLADLQRDQKILHARCCALIRKNKWGKNTSIIIIIINTNYPPIERKIIEKKRKSK